MVQRRTTLVSRRRDIARDPHPQHTDEQSNQEHTYACTLRTSWANGPRLALVALDVNNVQIGSCKPSRCQCRSVNDGHDERLAIGAVVTNGAGEIQPRAHFRTARRQPEALAVLDTLEVLIHGAAAALAGVREHVRV